MVGIPKTLLKESVKGRLRCPRSRRSTRGVFRRAAWFRPAL